MIGITSISASLPKYRISEKMISEAWGRPGGRSERTLRYFDEDSVTLGISAALSCLDDHDRESVEGLTHHIGGPCAIASLTIRGAR